MTKPIVILVPAYRCADTIAETLASIQKQGSLLNQIREVIVADDSSRDGTPEVARRAWSASVPLRIIERQFNYGEYANVNVAIEQLPTDIEWFLILHADDTVKDGWLAALLDRMEHTTSDVALIGSSYDLLSTDGTVRPGENEPASRVVRVTGTKASVADGLTTGCWWHISSSAIRVAAYREVGGLPKAMQASGDWDLMLRVLSDGWTIEHLPRSLMTYRQDPASASSAAFRRHMDIWATTTVVGRFHWALSASSLTRIHARYSWFLLRRVIRCLVNLDVVRLLWLFPAMGCVMASYLTCLLDRNHRVAATPRRAVEPRAV